MKKTLIDVGSGVVLSDAIAAILRGHSIERPEEGETAIEPCAIVVLRGGGNLQTERTYSELIPEVEEALKVSPLSDFVPDIAHAMELLQGKISSAPLYGSRQSDNEIDNEKDPDEKGVHKTVAKGKGKN